MPKTNSGAGAPSAVADRMADRVMRSIIAAVVPSYEINTVKFLPFKEKSKYGLDIVGRFL